MDVLLGTDLAGYRIDSVVGRGGMGVVYLAEHIRLHRRAALKVLTPELAEDPDFRDRFIRESELAASLEHPNIVPIYDAGEADGLLYLAMRFVDGSDLKTLIGRDGPPELPRVASIISQVASALDAAHTAGLVHRDVKSANVLVSPATPSQGEHAYLMDFGLTKRREGARGITKTGQFMGSVEYAAPEQLEGKAVDARSDVYSLGCVAFECLTGHPPYQGEGEVTVMMGHLREPVPKPTSERPDLPAEIDTIVARAMAKTPDDRYPTAGAFAEAVREGLTGRVGPGRPARSRRALVGAAVAVAAVAVIVGVALVLSRGGTDPPAALPTGPSGQAISGGAVRIDPATNQTVAGVPGRGVFTIGGGFLWVVTFPRGGTIDKVSAQNNQVIGMIDVRADALTFGEGALWATTPSENANTGIRHSIVRIDPTTNAVTDVATVRIREPIRAAGYAQGQLAVGPGAIWLAINTPTPPGKLVRIDLQTNEQRLVTLPLPADEVIVAADAVWVRSNQIDPTVFKLDPRDGAIVDRLSVGGADAIAGSDSAIWVADATDDAVIQIDPGTVRQVALITSEKLAGPDGIATWEDAVWVVSRATCTVERIDPVSKQVVASITPNTRDLKLVAAGDEGVWAGATQGFASSQCA